MRCFSCGAATSVLKVEPQDFIKARGFNLHTVQCPNCGLAEKRLTYDGSRSVKNGFVAHPPNLAASIEAVLGTIGDYEANRQIGAPQKSPKAPFRTVPRKLKVDPQPGPGSSRQAVAPKGPGSGIIDQLWGIEPSRATETLQPQPPVPPIQTDAAQLSPVTRNGKGSLQDLAERTARNFMQAAEGLGSDVAQVAKATPEFSPESASEPTAKDQLKAEAEPDAHEATRDALGEAPVPSYSLDKEEHGRRLKDIFGRVRAKIRHEPKPRSDRETSASTSKMTPG